MGIQHGCPNCGYPIGLNGYSKAKENGYCPHCDLDDLRKALRSARMAEDFQRQEVSRTTAALNGARCEILSLNSQLNALKTARKECCTHEWRWLTPDVMACVKCNARMSQEKPRPCVSYECPNCEGTGRLATKWITCQCPRCQP